MPRALDLILPEIIREQLHLGTAFQSSAVGAGRELVASCRKGLTPGAQGSGTSQPSSPSPTWTLPHELRWGRRARVCSTNHRGEGLSLTAGWASVRIWPPRSDAPGAGASLRELG